MTTWLRWSWRDLRRHWAAVISIAAVVAIGTGVFAGFGSSSAWRRMSNDASFAALRMHDLRLTLSPGTFVAEGDLVGLVDDALGDDAAMVTERLMVPTQVDASNGSDTVLVSGRIIGTTIDASTGGASVDDVWIVDGNAPLDGSADVLLEHKFAAYYDLPPAGTVRIAGGAEVSYSGTGIGPEEFYVVGEQASVLAEADFASLYTDLSTAQAVSGRPGVVNDVVVVLATGADRDEAVRAIEVELADRAGIAATVEVREDTEAYRVLYSDIDSDQQVWNLLSGLVLLAAALASFNLIGRIVEAQRREIGIGMALGAPRRMLAVRPVLIGVQVAVLGTLGGLGAGAYIGSLMRGLLESIVPMPIYVTPFQIDVFARGAVVGFLPPIVASIIPVWRALRVEPITAIRTGHLAATTGRLGGWVSRIALPGSSLVQMPLRNVLRAPRRTVLTAAGVGAAITALVATLGLLDSFTAAIDRGVAEATKGDPGRITVTLDTYYPVTSPEVTAVMALPGVATADPTLSVPATARVGTGEPLDLLLELLDFTNAQWTPTIIDAVPDGPTSGLVLTAKAARDLGVEPGDTVVLRHPRLGLAGIELVDTDMVVAAVHPAPIRSFAFLDQSFAAEFGLAGIANGLQVTPTAGTTRDELQRSIFDLAGIGSAQPVARVGEVFDSALDQFVGVLYIAEGAVLVLALLIAFNSTRISVDERRREHATMLAFGMRLRTLVGVVVGEAVVIGVLATLVGLAAGVSVQRWMLQTITRQTVPEFDLPVVLAPGSIAVAFAVGVASTALAPLFVIGRMRRMNLPDTLRVME